MRCYQETLSGQQWDARLAMVTVPCSISVVGLLGEDSFSISADFVSAIHAASESGI